MLKVPITKQNASDWTSGLGRLKHLPDFLASLAAAILKMNQHGDVRGSGDYFTDLVAGGVWKEGDLIGYTSSTTLFLY
jgi:hypothetical protein